MKEQAIRNYLNKDLLRLTFTVDAIAHEVCFWSRVRVSRYDVIEALRNMGEKPRLA
jgi:hypothetical protein